MFRYVHFLGSLGIVLYILFVLQAPPELESLRELYWFLIGNLIYYGLGFLLAVVLKDNRAVCKYVCPIPVFQKIGSRFSLMKINIKRENTWSALLANGRVRWTSSCWTICTKGRE